MIDKAETWPRRADLEEAIKRAIAERTSGRIHQLVVEVREERLVIYGCASSFHLKQLAIQGILEVLGNDRLEIDVQISVKRPMTEASVDQTGGQT
jgi:hypothetical protein